MIERNKMGTQTSKMQQSMPGLISKRDAVMKKMVSRRSRALNTEAGDSVMHESSESVKKEKKEKKNAY